MPHFIGRYSLGPEPAIDGLATDPEVLGKLIDGEEFTHDSAPSLPAKNSGLTYYLKHFPYQVIAIIVSP